MAKIKLDKSKLKWTDSDYLCLFCYEPIYYNVESKKEICANPNCISHCPRPIILKYDPTSAAIQEFKEEYNKVLELCYEFSKEFFFRRIFEIRAIMCLNFFQNKGLKIEDLLGVNYLLVSIQKVANWGTATDVKKCNMVIIETLKKYSDLRFIENLELRNFLIDENNQVWVMKYYDVIMGIRKELGIVDGTKYGPEDVNTFYFIDRQARIGNPTNPHDFTTIFKNHYNLVTTTNHLFKFGYFISQIHKYPVKTSDLAMLFSLWTACQPTELASVDRDGLKTIYDGAIQVNHLVGNFDDFLENYTSGKKFAPLVIFDGSQYHFDYFTLFIFMLYVFSLNKKIEGTQTLSGFQTLNEQRMASAKIFEKVIRDKFRKEEYYVFPQNDDHNFVVSVKGVEHEFDCIAIDHSKKIIVLVDAKYEDIAPSSTVGETVVDQTVLDGHDGSLLHAIAQHERRQFFIQNFDDMHCNVKQFWDYRIISIVVSKHIPMIKKHLSTTLMSYKEFQNHDFRSID